jgi:hypothetical protein
MNKAILLLLFLFLSLPGCKKETKTELQESTTHAASVVMSIDGKKNANPFRVQIPFIDLNTAFLNHLTSGNRGC